MEPVSPDIFYILGLANLALLEAVPQLYVSGANEPSLILFFFCSLELCFWGGGEMTHFSSLFLPLIPPGSGKMS